MIAEAERVTGTTPVPERATVCGLVSALLAMLKTPAGTGPNAAGVNVSPTAQVMPGPSEPEAGHCGDCETGVANA